MDLKEIIKYLMEVVTNITKVEIIKQNSEIKKLFQRVKKGDYSFLQSSITKWKIELW